jgi:hypothetical protein
VTVTSAPNSSSRRSTRHSITWSSGRVQNCTASSVVLSLPSPNCIDNGLSNANATSATTVARTDGHHAVHNDVAVVIPRTSPACFRMTPPPMNPTPAAT